MEFDSLKGWRQLSEEFSLKPSDLLYFQGVRGFEKLMGYDNFGLKIGIQGEKEVRPDRA